MKNKITLLLLICSILASCDKFGGNDYAVSGKIQKGPFTNGSDVVLYELDEDLQQTGNSFLSTISADDGSFSFSSVKLDGSYALLDAEGFYFSELFGEVSPSQISLHAISDLSIEEEVNVNVMTHLTIERLEKLVAGGQTFSEAKSQAESELLDFLGVTESIEEGFEGFDISKAEEQDAVLLALSVILQRTANESSEKLTLPAGLTSLLSVISSDFGEDGTIDDIEIIDTLLHNISHLNPQQIKKNLEEKFTQLGVSAEIPDFNKYIAVFQKKYSDVIYTEFTYPEYASPDLLNSPEAVAPNLLYGDATELQPYPYSIAAIVPFDAKLTIKINIQNGSSEYPFAFSVMGNGWEIDNNYPNGITLHSQKNNELMSLLFYLENWGSAIIEYYEDGTETPTHTKSISWGDVEM